RLPFATADAYAGRLPAAASDVARSVLRGDRVAMVTSQAQRFHEVLDEQGVRVPRVAERLVASSGGTASLLQGALSEGWRVATPGGQVALVTDRELFGFVKQRRSLRRQASQRSRFLAEVAPGDFVVHSEHGIARFAGIVRRPVGEVERDYLELRYAGD